MTEPEQGFTTELQADIAAEAEHPDVSELTPDERRHLGLPDPDEERDQ